MCPNSSSLPHLPYPPLTGQLAAYGGGAPAKGAEEAPAAIGAEGALASSRGRLPAPMAEDAARAPPPQIDRSRGVKVGAAPRRNLGSFAVFCLELGLICCVLPRIGVNLLRSASNWVFYRFLQFFPNSILAVGFH